MQSKGLNEVCAFGVDHTSWISIGADCTTFGTATSYNGLISSPSLARAVLAHFQVTLKETVVNLERIDGGSSKRETISIF